MASAEFQGLSTAGGFGQVGGGLPDDSDLDVLVQRSEVRDELALSAGQREALDELARTHQNELVEAARGLTAQPVRTDAWYEERRRAADERIRQILDAEQFERLLRRRWQLLGPRAVFDPEVGRRLGLSPEQLARLREARAKVEAKRREVHDAISHLRSPAAALDYVRETFSQPAGELCRELLDESQQAALRQLTSSSE